MAGKSSLLGQVLKASEQYAQALQKFDQARQSGELSQEELIHLQLIERALKARSGEAEGGLVGADDEDDLFETEEKSAR